MRIDKNSERSEIDWLTGIDSSPYSGTRVLLAQRSLQGTSGESRPTSPRPRLRRESAQELEDCDFAPGINIELGELLILKKSTTRY